jgi:hypothetical protein
MLKCKHQCHCVRSSYIATCIINDWETSCTQKETKIPFVYSCFDGKYQLSTQNKIQKITKLNNIISYWALMFTLQHELPSIASNGYVGGLC